MTLFSRLESFLGHLGNQNPRDPNSTEEQLPKKKPIPKSNVLEMLFEPQNENPFHLAGKNEHSPPHSTEEPVQQHGSHSYDTNMDSTPSSSKAQQSGESQGLPGPLCPDPTMHHTAGMDGYHLALTNVYPAPHYPPPGLPDGWISLWDKRQGASYYVKTMTGHSQWSFPTETGYSGATDLHVLLRAIKKEEVIRTAAGVGDSGYQYPILYHDTSDENVANVAQMHVQMEKGKAQEQEQVNVTNQEGIEHGETKEKEMPRMSLKCVELGPGVLPSAVQTIIIEGLEAAEAALVKYGTEADEQCPITDTCGHESHKGENDSGCESCESEETPEQGEVKYGHREEVCPLLEQPETEDSTGGARGDPQRNTGQPIDNELGEMTSEVSDAKHDVDQEAMASSTFIEEDESDGEHDRAGDSLSDLPSVEAKDAQPAEDMAQQEAGTIQAHDGLNGVTEQLLENDLDGTSSDASNKEQDADQGTSTSIEEVGSDTEQDVPQDAMTSATHIKDEYSEDEQHIAQQETEDTSIQAHEGPVANEEQLLGTELDGEASEALDEEHETEQLLGNELDGMTSEVSDAEQDVDQETSTSIEEEGSDREQDIPQYVMTGATHIKAEYSEDEQHIAQQETRDTSIQAHEGPVANEEQLLGTELDGEASEVLDEEHETEQLLGNELDGMTSEVSDAEQDVDQETSTSIEDESSDREQDIPQHVMTGATYRGEDSEVEQDIAQPETGDTARQAHNGPVANKDQLLGPELDGKASEVLDEEQDVDQLTSTSIEEDELDTEQDMPQDAITGATYEGEDSEVEQDIAQQETGDTASQAHEGSVANKKQLLETELDAETSEVSNAGQDVHQEISTSIEEDELDEEHDRAKDSLLSLLCVEGKGSHLTGDVSQQEAGSIQAYGGPVANKNQLFGNELDEKTSEVSDEQHDIPLEALTGSVDITETESYLTEDIAQQYTGDRVGQAHGRPDGNMDQLLETERVRKTTEIPDEEHDVPLDALAGSIDITDEYSYQTEDISQQKTGGTRAHAGYRNMRSYVSTCRSRLCAHESTPQSSSNPEGNTDQLFGNELDGMTSEVPRAVYDLDHEAMLGSTDFKAEDSDTENDVAQEGLIGSIDLKGRDSQAAEDAPQGALVGSICLGGEDFQAAQNLAHDALIGSSYLKGEDIEAKQVTAQESLVTSTNLLDGDSGTLDTKRTPLFKLKRRPPQLDCEDTTNEDDESERAILQMWSPSKIGRAFQVAPDNSLPSWALGKGQRRAAESRSA